jgi:hypothetical protein
MMSCARVSNDRIEIQDLKLIVLFTSCSPDPACRNAGVKFRYCSHCKAPVAKRNFRRRHNHGYTNEEDSNAHEDSVAEDTRAGADDERKMKGPQSKKIKHVVPPETNSSILTCEG